MKFVISLSHGTPFEKNTSSAQPSDFAGRIYASGKYSVVIILFSLEKSQLLQGSYVTSLFEMISTTGWETMEISTCSVISPSSFFCASSSLCTFPLTFTAVSSVFPFQEKRSSATRQAFLPFSIRFSLHLPPSLPSLPLSAFLSMRSFYRIYFRYHAKRFYFHHFIRLGSFQFRHFHVRQFHTFHGFIIFLILFFRFPLQLFIFFLPRRFRRLYFFSPRVP